MPPGISLEPEEALLRVFSADTFEPASFVVVSNYGIYFFDDSWRFEAYDIMEHVGIEDVAGRWNSVNIMTNDGRTIVLTQFTSFGDYRGALSAFYRFIRNVIDDYRYAKEHP